MGEDRSTLHRTRTVTASCYVGHRRSCEEEMGRQKKEMKRKGKGSYTGEKGGIERGDPGNCIANCSMNVKQL